MVNDRTALREHLRTGLLGTLLIATACLLGGCDHSKVGFEGTDFYATDEPAATDATSAPATPAAVAAVLGQPEAAAAVARWATDLRTHGLDGMTDRCWTMAPRNVQTMYADPGPILDALSLAGTADGSTASWRNDEVAVVAEQSDIASGYACPRVFPSGTEPAFDDADARHTVRRFLSRLAGKPLDPADVESRYPLLCDGSAQDRYPAAIAGFEDQAIKSDWPRGDSITVSVPVTTLTGIQKKQTYTLKSGAGGYCIGDVSG